MNECTECHKYVGKCPYCHRPRPSIAEWKALKGVSVPTMSAENRALLERVLSGGEDQFLFAGLNRLLDAARAEGPQPPAVKVDEGVREKVARLINPSSWRTMDYYLADFKRQYKGANAGYDPEQFQHKPSLAVADQILSLLGFCHNTTIS